MITNRSSWRCDCILFIHTHDYSFTEILSFILFLSFACSPAALPLFTYRSCEEITCSFLSLLTRLHIRHLHVSVHIINVSFNPFSLMFLKEISATMKSIRIGKCFHFTKFFFSSLLLCRMYLFCLLKLMPFK